ncbi:hypothetical protein ACFLT1_02665 [Bacteroidota bacterium]
MEYTNKQLEERIKELDKKITNTIDELSEIVYINDCDREYFKDLMSKFTSLITLQDQLKNKKRK